MIDHDSDAISVNDFYSNIVEPWEALQNEQIDALLASERIESRDTRMEIALREYCKKAFHEYFEDTSHQDELRDILRKIMLLARTLYPVKGTESTAPK